MDRQSACTFYQDAAISCIPIEIVRTIDEFAQFLWTKIAEKDRAHTHKFRSGPLYSESDVIAAR
jgi:hypothetical protein